ncbi:branched-chain amino acid ABC transporter permease [Comamonadaceae bacterium PP-2]
MKTLTLALLNGTSAAALYFLVAMGFTLTFGLMRTVNLAYGALYLFGGYVGYFVSDAWGNWYAGVAAGALAAAAVGWVLQRVVLDRLRGQDLRQALVTLGLAIVAADLMLAGFGGLTYQFDPPEWMHDFIELPGGMGGYPLFRIFVIGLSMVVGAILWLVLARTRVGLAVRAGVDDRLMLAAIGIDPARLFLLVSAVGAGMAGLAGVVGGTALSLSPGEDSRYLLASLVVAIVGGMGSLPGAAVGALAMGWFEQLGLLFFPTYSVALIYLLMVGVLAVRAQGLFGKGVA